MSEFRVEKTTREVQVTLVTDEHLFGTVFLERVARHKGGQQDPQQLLDDAENFFPLAVDGGVVLVAKDQVKLVRYSVDAESPVPVSAMVDIRVTLDDKSVLDGHIALERRSNADRLLDHLNRFHNRFLPMVMADGATQCLINRRMIVGVQQR